MNGWFEMQIASSLLAAFGALGVFLVGYRQITNVSMRWIGNWFRDRASRETIGRAQGVGLGALVAAGGSSASGAVSLITMVDSGAVTAERAIWMMAGLNLGATVVPWLIALAGFHTGLAMPALVLMAASLPFRLSGSLRRYTYGDLIAGLALALLSLDLMTGRLAVVHDPSFIIAALRPLSAPSVALPIGLIIGAGVSSVIRSSVGTVVLAMALVFRGWLSPGMAAAAAVGSTFGLTAISAFAASDFGVNARRAVVLHGATAFAAAISGLAVVIALDGRFVLLPGGDVPHSTLRAVLLVCGAHTLAQTIGVAVIRLIERPVLATALRFYPAPPRLPGTVRTLHPLAPTMPESVNANLLLSQSALAQTAGLALEMLMIVMNATQVGDDMDGATERTISLRAAVKDSEDEISASLTRNMQLPCSRAQAERIHQQQRIAQELALIADDCYKTMRLLARSCRKNYRFHQESREELFAFTAQIMDFLKYTSDYLAGSIEHPDWELASRMEDQVDAVRDKLKKRSRKTLERENDADIRGELAFIDIVAHLEHVGDRCLTISDTVRRLSRRSGR